ncbi:aminotransferase-like domain-containing protein [Halomonas sp. V046]|uniref:aminotransferase-like domain-containing protein n=1 Tax=Halomonas sp. V046 TaxID=3459611 RepID=UPI00404485A3
MKPQEIYRGQGDTLVAQVMSAVQREISGRRTASGARLPSIRALAQTLNVSRSTVVEAYDRLVADGVILAKRGSGFYVAEHLLPFSVAQRGPRLDREVDPLWITRQALEAAPGVLKPGCGWLPESWMPQADIRRSLRRLARAQGDHACLTEYASPLGLEPLRQRLSRRLAERGIEASPAQLMLTESGTQAIDLLCRFLIEPGATVLVDDPCYFNFHAMLRAHRATVIGVPYTATGPDMERFEQAVKEQAPRLYITNSALHNPTGATLAPATAHRILRLAEAHDMLIIEDDIFADLEREPAPRLAALDGLDRVLHIGSFSKTLSASVRCGFIAARPDWIDELVDLKLATSFGGGGFSAQLVLDLLEDGAYRKHLGGLRTRLADAMGCVGDKLSAAGLVAWTEPRAGMFLWCRLPAGLEAASVAREALGEGVVLAPGDAFSVSGAASGYLRFNVAQSLAPKVFAVLERAMERSATSLLRAR